MFGRLADRYGRRPTLMINVLCYSLPEFFSGPARTLTTFLILRALYGVAMGGEWGVGAWLTMESVSVKWRGPVSGLLQARKPELARQDASGAACQQLGRAAPARRIGRIRGDRDDGVQLLQPWLAGSVSEPVPGCAASSFACEISLISIIANVGAMLGGIGFGTLSQRIGRKWAIVIVALLTLPVLRLWAFSTTARERARISRTRRVIPSSIRDDPFHVMAQLSSGPPLPAWYRDRWPGQAGPRRGAKSGYDRRLV